MLCPQCNGKMAPQERICRRCRFLPELGRVVEIEPPRAGRAVRQRVMSRTRMFRLRRDRVERPKARRPFRIVAGIVPGMGHVFQDQWMRGLTYLFIVLGAVLAGSIVEGFAAQMLIGFAAAVHAHSLLELFPDVEWDNVLSRMVVMSGLLLALIAVIYWPMSRQLSLLNNDVIPIDGRYVTRYYATQMVEIVLVCGFLFVVAYAASVFLGVAASSFSGRRKNR